MDTRLANIIEKIQLDIAYNNIDHINHGGCGFFALMLAEELERNDIKYKWVYILSPWDSKDVLNNINLNNQGDDIDCSAAHVMIHIDGYYIDGECTYNLKQLKYRWLQERTKINFEMSYQDMVSPMYTSQWNKMYAMHIHNSIIKNIIKEAFNKYKAA